MLADCPVQNAYYSDRLLAHIIHDGSSRNRAAALRDRHAEPRRTDTYLKQYVEGLSGESAYRQACRSSAHE